jgi:hypothetical protein
MTTIVHAVKGGLLSYCDKVYSRANINQKLCIGGVMVSVLASSAVDRGFEPWSGQPKTIKLVFEYVNFQWDDDEVRFDLDQHAELDYYSASSLKQQSAGRHVAHPDTLYVL